MTTAPLIPLPRTFGHGTHGRDVLAVKRALASLGFDDLVIDREFGDRAVAELVAFKRSLGLPVNEFYGPRAHEALWPSVDGYGRRLFRLCSEALAAKPPDIRADIVKAAYVGYANRDQIHYTQDGRRWSGIDQNLSPPDFPPFADCSSFTTWAYWTELGDGPDIINGQNWNAGYTGTQTDHGRRVGISELQLADLVFYYHRDDPANGIGHVAMFIGDDRVISHGSEAGPLIPINGVRYRPVAECRTYLP